MKPKLSEAHVAKIMEHLLERFGDPIGDALGDRQGVPNKGGSKEDMGNRGFGAKLEAQLCTECPGMMDMNDHACTNCGKMPTALEPPPSPPKGAAPAVGTTITVVKGDGGGGSSGGGKFAQGLTVKDMDGIPTSGSGRGTDVSKPAAPKAAQPEAPPAAPSAPMSAELDEDESESKEDAQERLHYDIDHDGERGESPEHREKVLGHADELDEDDIAGADMDESAPMEEDMDLDQVAPPGREKQVKALKKQGKVKNPWAVAWSSYNKGHKD